MDFCILNLEFDAKVLQGILTLLLPWKQFRIVKGYDEELTPEWFVEEK